MVMRRTIGTFGILVTSLAALAVAPRAVSSAPGPEPVLAQRLQPWAAGKPHAAQPSCGSDERRKARREAALAKREAAAAKREEAAGKRGEAAQARREAAEARREAGRAKRQEAHASAQERREAAKAKREEAHASAKSKREEAYAAALARREERKAKLEEAKQRREEAAEERRERVASASRGANDDEPDDDIDSDVSPSPTNGFGTLRVNSRPWAQVYVDGKLVGHTPQLGLNVPAGAHNVRLVNSVFAMSKTFRLNVRQGERVTRVETLEE